MPTTHRHHLRTIILLTIIALLSLPSISLAIKSVTAATLDYAFEDKWYNTMGGAVPIVMPAVNVVPNQYFFIHTLLHDYALDSAGFANVTWNMNIINPAGDTVYAMNDAIALNFEIENPKLMQLSLTSLRMSCEDDYIRGEYHIYLTLFDHMANEYADDSTSFTLIDFKWPDWQEKGLEGLSKWMQEYYKRPDPVKALGAFYEISQIEYNESAYVPIMGCFLEIFENNGFLLDMLLDRYMVAPERVKTQTLSLLYFLNYDDSTFYNHLPPAERAYADNLHAYDNTFRDTLVTNSSQLDIFWSRFFASGKYDYIKYIVKALDFADNYELLKNYDGSQQPDSATAMELIKGSWFYSAQWSLKANCAHDLLVQDYCTYIFNNDMTLSQVAKRELGVILQSLN